ncbi:hypothetical protein E4T56_gene10828 [Termitomyces sp. T112]|nr:hypothetical protein E4T56_gene10828 [Termitomyces sp. T112]
MLRPRRRAFFRILKQLFQVHFSSIRSVSLNTYPAGCLSPASNVKLALDMINTPYEAVKCNIENGGTNPSFMSRSLQNMDESCDMELQEYIIKSTAGTMYAGELQVFQELILHDISWLGYHRISYCILHPRLDRESRSAQEGSGGARPSH